MCVSVSMCGRDGVLSLMQRCVSHRFDGEPTEHIGRFASRGIERYGWETLVRCRCPIADPNNGTSATQKPWLDSSSPILMHLEKRFYGSLFRCHDICVCVCVCECTAFCSYIRYTQLRRFTCRTRFFFLSFFLLLLCCCCRGGFVCGSLFYGLALDGSKRTDERASIVDLLLTAAWMCIHSTNVSVSRLYGGKDTVVDFAMPLIELRTLQM